MEEPLEGIGKTLGECQKIWQDSIPIRKTLKELSQLLSTPEDKLLERVQALLTERSTLLLMLARPGHKVSHQDGDQGVVIAVEDKDLIIKFEGCPHGDLNGPMPIMCKGDHRFYRTSPWLRSQE